MTTTDTRSEQEGNCRIFLVRSARFRHRTSHKPLWCPETVLSEVAQTHLWETEIATIWRDQETGILGRESFWASCRAWRDCSSLSAFARSSACPCCSTSPERSTMRQASRLRGGIERVQVRHDGRERDVQAGSERPTLHCAKHGAPESSEPRTPTTCPKTLKPEPGPPAKHGFDERSR